MCDCVCVCIYISCVCVCVQPPAPLVKVVKSNKMSDTASTDTMVRSLQATASRPSAQAEAAEAARVLSRVADSLDREQVGAWSVNHVGSNQGETQ